MAPDRRCTVMDLLKALRQYVKVRRALGSKLRDPAVTLGHFVEFLRQEGAAFITTDLAVHWVLRREHVQPATRARLLSMIRKFAVWRSAFDGVNNRAYCTSDVRVEVHHFHTHTPAQNAMASL
jgi:hypothetical protein